MTAQPSRAALESTPEEDLSRIHQQRRREDEARELEREKTMEKGGNARNGLSKVSGGAFKAKREDLAKGRCHWNNKPSDLAPIDNSSGLGQRAESLFCADPLKRPTEAKPAGIQVKGKH